MPDQQQQQQPYTPALLVVDFQEDFCPPSGSLAVPSGRAISTPVNTLLTYPFTTKIATRDYHPQTHISFAKNHHHHKPFTKTTLHHPTDATKTQESVLWPVHCVQGTPGADLVPELDVTKLDDVVDKGMNEKVEMYSVFYDNFHVEDSGLAQRFRDLGVTHVFVVGLAADYCVKHTALHAREEGFVTYVVEEATRAVDPESGWREDLERADVGIISMDGPEVARVKALPKREG